MGLDDVIGDVWPSHMRGVWLVETSERDVKNQMTRGTCDRDKRKENVFGEGRGRSRSTIVNVNAEIPRRGEGRVEREREKCRGSVSVWLAPPSRVHGEGE